MPALQRHMEASGVVPQLTVSLGPLSPLGSLLACSSSFSFSCGAAGSRTPSCGAPRSSNSPDQACSSSGCSTRHSGTRPQYEACQDNQLQQVCTIAIVPFALHVSTLVSWAEHPRVLIKVSSLHPWATGALRDQKPKSTEEALAGRHRALFRIKTLWSDVYMDVHMVVSFLHA